MKNKSIMLQGTASSVGKSVLTAALCRIFKEDGLDSMPFKSQNMALNSYITDEGLEMGRAQVCQAEAAMVKPEVNMNPILLKPTGEKNAQVIVSGKVYGNMSASEYHQFKPKLKKIILSAFDELQKKADVIVIEGAGSPAEINLKDNDIVNMGMAKMVDAPVLLIGDIDRGGVFASIYGTIMLLDEDERKRVKGLLINKFRGDRKILNPGLKQLEALTGIPVLGVIPYGKFDIEEEDGEAERLKSKALSSNKIDVCVIRLPRISNFTDFHWLEKHPLVNIRFVEDPGLLGRPDLIIIPGTKNTLEDLLFLREKGLDKSILSARDKGSAIVGICGGFQILGKKLVDPHGVESNIRELEGLGLLNVETIFDREKVTKQTKAEVIFENIDNKMKNIAVEGYEIHMGKTTLNDEAKPFAEIKDSQEFTIRYDGAISSDGKVWGTYLHGIFDNEEFNNALLMFLSNDLNIDEIEKRGSFKAYKEEQYDILAKTVRESIDMKRIYEILEEHSQ
ncbi:cobyric acid synthase [Tindallia californiensis]|uniref:Cobyric acid synthase n=1 Tax=Tindallia californiensis TaxID=159292 RepID=A0A1H3I9I5_9FIRM|nr:cobyric acid synthase [Tindallia californiensis]SDY24301.1 adenosylcobyric acid synthase (glutamine-hydrolysing) [Tindallia californiensis]